jgi:hypothetical protein
MLGRKSDELDVTVLAASSITVYNISSSRGVEYASDKRLRIGKMHATSIEMTHSLARSLTPSQNGRRYPQGNRK